MFSRRLSFCPQLVGLLPEGGGGGPPPPPPPPPPEIATTVFCTILLEYILVWEGERLCIEIVLPFRRTETMQ